MADIEKTIEEGPLRGLPTWVRNLREIIGSYGEQVSHLTAENEELRYAVAGVASVVIERFARDVQEGEGPMDTAERLLEELWLLRSENDLQYARIKGLEEELESLRANGAQAPK